MNAKEIKLYREADTPTGIEVVNWKEKGADNTRPRIFWLEPYELPTEEEIGDCFKVGDSKDTIVNRICDLFPKGFIKRPEGNQKVSTLSKPPKPISEGYHDVEEFYKEDDKCPQCESTYIMEHRYDDSYKICMSCKHNWKT